MASRRSRSPSASRPCAPRRSARFTKAGTKVESTRNAFSKAIWAPARSPRPACRIPRLRWASGRSALMSCAPTYSLVTRSRRGDWGIMARGTEASADAASVRTSFVESSSTRYTSRKRCSTGIAWDALTAPKRTSGSGSSNACSTTSAAGAEYARSSSSAVARAIPGWLGSEASSASSRPAAGAPCRPRARTSP